MTYLSRRDLLECLAAACASTALTGCSRRYDPYGAERVCIHVFHPRQFVPAPLAEKTDIQPRRSAGQQYFNIGLPELVVCQSRGRLLDLFQYFWPFSRDDFETLQKAIEIRYQKSIVSTASDVREFATYLREHRPQGAVMGASSAVIFTWNEYTRQWSADIVAACRESDVQEFVVFKNPAEPPYLCDFPAMQKGFKRPPR